MQQNNRNKNENSRTERRIENRTEAKTLGQTIRYYRRLGGLTQEQLAERADLNDKLISFYETDKRTPPIFNMISIAAALGVSLDELCGVRRLENPSSELEREIKDILKKYRIERV